MVDAFLFYIFLLYVSADIDYITVQYFMKQYKFNDSFDLCSYLTLYTYLPVR